MTRTHALILSMVVSVPSFLPSVLLGRVDAVILLGLCWQISSHPQLFLSLFIENKMDPPPPISLPPNLISNENHYRKWTQTQGFFLLEREGCLLWESFQTHLPDGLDEGGGSPLFLPQHTQPHRHGSKNRHIPTWCDFKSTEKLASPKPLDWQSGNMGSLLVLLLRRFKANCKLIYSGCSYW